MKRAAKGKGKSVQITVSIWWNARKGVIHIRPEGNRPLTISANSRHERGHPKLFHMLADYLRATGAPAPLASGKTAKRSVEPA
jgi:hypothetical protein